MKNFTQGIQTTFTLHREGLPPSYNEMKDVIKQFFATAKAKCTAMVIGLECGDKGRWHGQGYMMFDKKQRIVTIRKWLPSDGGIKCLVTAGTPHENLIYCTKHDKVEDFFCIRFGEFPDTKQGNRSDITAFTDDIQAHASIPHMELSMFREHPSVMLKYGKMAARWMDLETKCRRREEGFSKPIVQVFWGPTRLGKSRRAAYEAAKEVGEDNIYRKHGSKWYSTYDGERGIILEEFNGSTMSPQALLVLLDGYPTEGETKGGFKTIMATHFWITSNDDPNTWWADARERKPGWDGWDAIRARFTQVVHFSGEWVPPVVPVASTSGDVVVTDNQEGMCFDSPYNTPEDVILNYVPPAPPKKKRKMSSKRCLFIDDEAGCDEDSDDEVIESSQ